jgi:ubiquinone biosynthesis monooxygenase Coq6
VVPNRLVVGADGAQSSIRRMAGISTASSGYGQDAIVATVKVAQYESTAAGTNRGANDVTDPSANTAWQRYLSTGPLALLPLWGPYRSIVWSLPVLEANRLKALSPEDFLDELNFALQSLSAKPPPTEHQPLTRQIGNLFDGLKNRSVSKTVVAGISLAARPYRYVADNIVALGDTVVAASLSMSPQKVPPLIESVESARLTFPLQMQQASEYASRRLALIGDAAHSIHPQAGQGLNLGLQDAEDLADAVTKAVHNGADVGDMTTLGQYAGNARRRAGIMMHGVDLINTVFGRGKGTPGSMAAKVAEVAKEIHPSFDRDFGTALSLGLAGIQVNSRLKKIFARRAMGME